MKTGMSWGSPPPPCGSYQSLIVIDELLCIGDKLRACNSKQELSNVAVDCKALKNAYADLMTMARAALGRLQGALKTAQDKREQDSVGEQAPKRARSCCHVVNPRSTDVCMYRHR